MARLPFDPGKMAGASDKPSANQAPLTVSRLAAMIDSALKEKLPQPLRVVGEISGLSARTHWYFRLADDAAPEGAEAVLDCVMFASALRRVGFEPRNGQRVLLTGRVEFYARQGRTQFYAERMVSVGAGDLDQRLKALIEELKALGWLDPQRKRPLPAFPRRIAVVTSRTGAALQDVLVTMRRRCPAVEVAIIDVRVQGEGAAEQVARALNWISANHESNAIEAVIVTRGGGSAEDLWAFNERIVAEAIVRSSVPVVAAIGHETDTTIAELVADERCATPTQAAMRLTPDRDSLIEQLDQLNSRLLAAMARNLDRAAQRLRASARSRFLTDPAVLILIPAERLQERARRLVAAEHRRIAVSKLAVERMQGRLAALNPQKQAALRTARLDELNRRLVRSVRSRLTGVNLDSLRQTLTDAWTSASQARRARLVTLERELVVTSPMHVLSRGYSVTTDAGGRAIRSPSDVTPGQTVTTRVAAGAFRSSVIRIQSDGTVPALPVTAVVPPPRAARARSAPRQRVDPSRGPRPDQLGLFGSGAGPE